MPTRRVEGREVVRIREYDEKRDLEKVLDLERNCEVGSKKRPILVIDHLGDPLCRIRNSPQYHMYHEACEPLDCLKTCAGLNLDVIQQSTCFIAPYLMAEDVKSFFIAFLIKVAESGKNLVGVVCGAIKVATISNSSESPAKLGYILGLRVLTRYRCNGIGKRLVIALEYWFCLNHVDYAYMATEKSNEASIKLFTYKLGYTKFRTPTILVNPVWHKPTQIDPNVVITKLPVDQAESLYRNHMSSLEFFPQDIDQVLSNKLNLGTYIACRHSESSSLDASNWAMLSVWNCPYRIRVARLSILCLIRAKLLRHLERIFPCFKGVGIPNITSFFRFFIIYGAHMEGPEAAPLMRALCMHVHNMAARQKGYTVVIAEVGGEDGVRFCIPHRRDLSFSSDVWCIKDLRKVEGKTVDVDWNVLPPSTSIFLDPREF